MKIKMMSAMGWLAIALMAMGAPGARATDDGWALEVTPYFWAVGLDGEVGVGGLPPADVDMSFSDVWDDFENGVAVFGIARNGPWLAAIDFSYLDTKTTENLPETRVTLDNDSVIAKLIGGHRLTSVESPVQADVYTGGRYCRFKSKLSLSGIGSRSETEDWLDPLLGVNLMWPFADAWRANLLADIGGFGAGSDLAWEIMPVIQYQFNETFSGKVGYRWLDVDYDSSGYVSDLLTHGWMAGVGMSF